MSRRLMLRNASGGGGGLPSEYQQVEWIRNVDGSGYINTGIIIPRLFPTTIKCGFMELDCGFYAAIACSTGGGANSVRNSGFSVHNEVKARRGNSLYGSGSNAPLGKYVEAEATYTETEITVKAVFPDAVFTTTHQSSELAFGNNLLVFYDYLNQNMTGRIYFLKIVQCGLSIVDLVPCYLKSDGTIGMFDLVSQSFFTATRGTLAKGADVN